MYKSIKELMTAAADKFRGYLGMADKIATQDFPAKIDEVYAAGQASGGGGASDPAAEAVMAAMALSTSTILGSWNSSPANGMFTCSGSDTATTIGIILDNIVEIHSYAYCISQLWYLANTPPIILSLPKIPPIAGIGSFVVENTNHKPKVIYVPDESVGAYKAAEYWSEFADFIKPMSDLQLVEFRIENPYTGGWANFKAKQGMTWGEWLESDYCTEKDNFKLALDKVAYIDYPPISSSEDRQNGEFVSLTDLIIDGESYTQP